MAIRPTHEPRMPPEIVDVIIHHARDDRPTLLCWSLVSQHWLHATRRILFDNVHIRPSCVVAESFGSPAQYRFMELCTAPLSTLPLYVNHITITPGTRGPYEYPPQWLTEAMISFIRAIGARSIELDGLDWDAITIASFQRCVTTTLQHIHLESNGFPAHESMFRLLNAIANPSLSSLRVTMTRLWDLDSTAPCNTVGLNTTLVPSFSLDSLAVAFWHGTTATINLLRWLVANPQSISGLRRLELHRLGEDGFSVLQSMIYIARDSLQELDLSFYTKRLDYMKDCPDFRFMFNLSKDRIPFLQHLVLPFAWNVYPGDSRRGMLFDILAGTSNTVRTVVVQGVEHRWILHCGIDLDEYIVQWNETVKLPQLRGLELLRFVSVRPFTINSGMREQLRKGIHLVNGTVEVEGEFDDEE